MAEVRFEAVLERHGNGTALAVPVDVKATFGRVRAPVVVTVNGHTWRSTLMRYAGRDLLGISRANREAAGIAPGAAFTHRREWVEWVEEAKRPETRERRLRGVVEQVLARGA